MKDLTQLIRPAIRSFVERHEVAELFPDTIAVRLHANENPFNAPYNRYPSEEENLKSSIGRIRGIRPDCIHLGNGTHAAVDALCRIFCTPRKDNVVGIVPTCGLYEDVAALNDVEYRRVRLNETFDITADSLLRAADERSKLIFLCSPNSPTGNLLNREEILKTAECFDGFVVIDEAYVRFSRSESLLGELDKHPNLILLNTFSTAWASAGIRLSVVYAVPQLIRYLDSVCADHPVATPVLREAVDVVKRPYDVDKWVKQILDERDKVMAAFRQLPVCEKIFPTHSNFFLTKVRRSAHVYDYLLSQGIAVRYCRSLEMCEDCLRISIGLTSDNDKLLGALRKYNQN